MTRRILVPLDGSPLAEAALPHAAALARAAGDELLLLRVVTPAETSQSLFWKATIPAELREEWEEATLERADIYLRDTAARLRGAGLRVTTEVSAADDAAEAIVARADQDPHIGLVAMATHGRGGLGRWVLGSVASKVLQAVATPLLLVRAREEAPPAAEVTYRTMLVPLDGSGFAELALAEARLLAAATGAELVLVAVVGEGEDATQAAAYLDEVATRLRADHLAVRTRVLAGSPAERLLEAADEEHADLIVMATHGRGGWRRLWLGSVASKVVEGATAPVLLVRAQQ
ncbi:MAG TPA: universal stress protein [Roseiflexaceae bacterium]|nr:universal stress protein [Roseiflexaceae bacterium]